MLYLILAVCCNLAIGMIFKYTGQQRLDAVALLTVNYAVAALVAGVLLLREGSGVLTGAVLDAPLLVLGVVTGALFIGGFFVYALATQMAGLSLAIGVMRVSVVVPFLASWVIWSEVPSVAQSLGLVIAGAAFFMIARRHQDAPTAPTEQPGSAGGVFGILVILFLAGGLVDVMMKTFDEAFADHHSRAVFLLLVFGIALFIGLVFVVSKGVRTGVWPDRATWVWGIILGLINYGSAAFLLRAIEELSGPFVFPANSIALVIGGALLGIFVWGEHLSRLNWLGLACAAIALVLLNL
ncbi:MAG TPA: DMT family transporter [Rhodothermales bacterium]|nr:DMT family transporter [Rhodothermales bacterium]